MKRYLALLVLSGMMGSVQAFNPATAKIYCLSLDLGPVKVLQTGTTPDNFYFTTYDDAAGLPLFATLGDGFQFSGELSPAEVGAYRTDYCEFISGRLASFGTIAMIFPDARDLDTNGVPDFLQVEQPGSLQFIGTFTCEFPVYTALPLSGHLTRSANSSTGSYTAFVQSGTNSMLLSGELQILNTVVQFTYSRWPTNQLTFAGATSSFSVASPDQVQFPSLTLNSAWGTISSKSCTVRRNGKFYLGRAEFTDGNPYTSWPDYTQWLVQIDDPNDIDGNGIPDLSDTPLLMRPTLSQPRFSGDHLVFRVRATPNVRYRIETSTNLLAWLPLAVICPFTNWMDWTDPHSAKELRRFYRLAPP